MPNRCVKVMEHADCASRYHGRMGNLIRRQNVKGRGPTICIVQMPGRTSPLELKESDVTMV